MAAYIVYLSPCFYIQKHIDVKNGTRNITTEYWRNAREYVDWEKEYTWIWKREEHAKETARVWDLEKKERWLFVLIEILWLLSVYWLRYQYRIGVDIWRFVHHQRSFVENRLPSNTIEIREQPDRLVNKIRKWTIIVSIYSELKS